MTKTYSMESQESPTNGKNGDLFTAKSGDANGVYVSVGGAHVDNTSSEDVEEEKKKDAPVSMVGVFELFRFSTARERFMMFIGTIMAIAHGAAMPVMIILFGNMTDLFVDDAIFDNVIEAILPNLTVFYPNMTRDWILENPEDFTSILTVLNMTDILDVLGDLTQGGLLDQMRTYASYYAIIGAGVLLIAYLQVACWQLTAYAQCQRIRSHLFESILRQNIGWFDVHEIGELNTRISDDVDQLEMGIGEKLSMLLQQIASFLAGFVIGFVYGWKLTLVIIAVSPLLAASAGFMGWLGANMTTKELSAYAKAGAIAEEVLGAMRTVVAFGGQQKECDRYLGHLVEAKDIGVKKSAVAGGGMGLIFFVIFGSYALAFWYGSRLILNEGYTPGGLLIVFFAVLIGAFQIGGAGPNIQDFSTSRGAAHAIYSIIDLQPPIDNKSEKGVKPDIIGNVEFKDIVFRYPSREEVTVLKKINFKVSVGQTVALVGASGCGKSTSIQLIQRFYDPEAGQVLLDGVDVRDYHLKYLRQHIGVVSQEPVLFATTIEDNIRYGREGVTKEEIETAARAANAHNFIMNLPKKYSTLVGERGAQLSGGQKQRIAIARALVRDPKVLLLDEATSALDTESEATVQNALDTARMGRTTIVVAHRLSTIKNADLIVGFDNGNIVEMGTHDELMNQGGVYYTLVNNQSQKAKGEDEDEEDDEFVPRAFKRALSVESNHSGRKRGISVSEKKGLERSLSVAKAEEEDEDLPDPGFKRILRLNAPEWHFMALGGFASIISGGIQPCFALVFAEILGVFSNVDRDEMEKQSNLYSLLFLAIGVVAGLAMFTMSYMFGKSGEYLTMRMREMTFKALLRQDVSYFDDHLNSTGALCTRLATDASAVKGATGSRLATMCQSLASVGAGIGIGFAFSWQLSLLIMAFAPFLLISGFVQMKILQGNKAVNKAAMEESGKIAIETIESIRTVAALTKEDSFHVEYCNLIAGPYGRKHKRAHLQGLAFGMSQCVVFFAYAACFTLGAYLIQEGQLDYTAMFRVFGAIVFSAMSAGQASSFAPDYGKAKISAARLFALFDRVPLIDSSSEEGQKPSKVEGRVELMGTEFNYPTRPDVPVLRGVDIQVNPGQTVALVGSSGCGKSTIVQLLERFYDPANGIVKLDGVDLKDIHIQWLRSQMGIVSQEPVLFDCSIKDNIAYGDNTRIVPMSEIIEAARKANAHNFIEALPKGYDTNVGDKGTQLSGGQKQRVAIARALVRNPRLLLLDEATSALDTESEKVVQEALDRAQEGRTSIVIAHRLSTIQNADLIIVIHNGQVAETGTHSQLLALEGIYYKLNNAQLRQR